MAAVTAVATMTAVAAVAAVATVLSLQVRCNRIHRRLDDEFDSRLSVIRRIQRGIGSAGVHNANRTNQRCDEYCGPRQERPLFIVGTTHY